MVAYSFKKRFIEQIRAGAKRHTIRSDRKRHARPGEQLQLYAAMRTVHCTRIGVATCRSVFPIRLDLEDGRIEYPDTGRALTTLEELDGFAQSDGFADWQDMRRFWEANHPGVRIYSGIQISWGDTFQVLA